MEDLPKITKSPRSFESKVENWIESYMGKTEEAEGLKNIILYHHRKESKRKVMLGIFIGFVSFLIFLKWLS